MKRIFPLLFALGLLVSCISTVPATDQQAAPPTGTKLPAASTPTSAVTSTPVPPTATPQPAPRWYWAIDDETRQFLTVNQFGETRSLGSLPAAELENYRAYPVDPERAVLFTETESGFKAYLLTPDGMQPIELPSLYKNDLSRQNWYVPAVYGDMLVFAYSTQSSSGGRGSVMAERGPLVLLDLKSLTARLLDEEVNHDILSYSMDVRLWGHLSEDGRFLRYLNGNADEMSVRQVDLVTGEVSTIYTTTGHATSRIIASLPGDMWLFALDDLVIDLEGNQMEYADSSRGFRPLRDGKVVTMSYECEDNCEVVVVSPFTGEADLVYNLPWSPGLEVHNPLVNQLAPDGGLIYMGASFSWLTSIPALLDEYPALEDGDYPVFRLTTDGGSSLIGIFGFDIDRVPASSDGRYLLLTAADLTSFFIYDVFENRTVAELPALPDLDYFWANMLVNENGIFVQLTADSPHDTYRDFFLVHFFATGESFSWEANTGETTSCVDVLPDMTLVCWDFVYDPQTATLVRFDPETQAESILLENAWYVIPPD